MGKARSENRIRLLSVLQPRRSALLMGTALQTGVSLLLVLPAEAQPAPNARPAGGVVAAGSAAISQSPSTTTITQASQRAAVNWQSFDVGSQQTVQFRQPSASAMTLNRVAGPDPSRIAGKIDANGQVVLVNQSGVTFYKGAQVNTTGLMVSAVGITNPNFMAGKMVFDQPGNPNAKISNAGTITVKQAGLAALVAPQVANSGVINARLGHVVLAGAKTATLDLYGDGLLSLDVSNQVTQAPVGPDGKAATALVTNTGVIAADGGTVQLTARAADGIVQTLVRSGGTMRAATVGSQTGTVALNGVGGSIEVVGQLSATGASGPGGAITVVADGAVTVGAGARVDASGRTGGGVVAIGTTLARARGGPAVTGQQTAGKAAIAQGATIAANATGTGDGGRVTVLSKGPTQVNGSIAAKGGPKGGNGGSVEVSGDTLGLQTGSIDVSAPLGSAGNILFDPRDLDIVAAGTGDGNVTSGGLPVGNPDQATDITVSASALTGLNGNLLIEASRNLSVDAGLTFSNQTAGQSITFLAGNNLTVNQPISTAGGDLVLRAAVQTDGTTTFANFNPAGSLAINAAVGSPTTGAITMSAGVGGIALGANVFGSTVDLSTTGGGIAQTAGGLTAATLQSAGGVVGGATLMSPTNAVGSIGTLQVTGGSFALSNSAPLTVAGALSSDNNVYLQTSNPSGIAIAPTGTVAAAAASNASFQATALSNAGTITGGTFEFAPNAGGTVALGAGGSLNSLAGIAANNIEIGGITVSGSLTPAASLITTTGSFDVGNRPLALNSTGAIIEGVGAPITNVSNLTGSAASVLLGETNGIANLGNFAVTGGDFLLADAGLPGTLNVIGPLTATNVTLSGNGALAISGSIGAPGFVDLTGFTSVGESGGISAGTLRSSGGTGGDVSLLGNNSIGDLGNFAVGGSGGFALLDNAALHVAGTASVSGPVAQLSLHGPGVTVDPTGALVGNSGGGLVSLQTDTFSNNGNITAATLELAPKTIGLGMTLGASGGLSLASMAGITTSNLIAGAVTPPGGSRGVTAGSISVGGSFDTTGVAALTLDASGAVSGAAPLTGGSQITGRAASYVLLNPGNRFSAVNLTANSGNLELFDALPGAILGGDAASGNVYLAGPSFQLNGTVSATGTLGVQTDALNVLAGSLTGGKVELAPLTSGASVTLGAFGGLSLLNSGVVTGNLRIGSIHVPTTGLATTAGTIVVGGNFGSPGLVMELDSLGGISETGAAALTAASLTGSAGNNVTLGNANKIAALTGFNDAGFRFALNNIGALNVAGAINAGTVAIADSGTLTVNSAVSASAVSLTAGSINIPGLVNGGSVVLTGTTGSVAETGTLIAGTLTGSAATSAHLSGATSTTNQIGTLGAYSAPAGFTLNDGVPLVMAGNVSGGSGVTIVDKGALAINGAVTAVAVSLSADSISASGIINAATLNGSAVSSATLDGANQIGTLASVNAPTGFSLHDLIPLTVTGTVSGGPNVTIVDSGTLVVNGALSATAVSLTADSIAIPGTVNGGSVALTSTVGAISEPGTLIAGTLTGHASTSADFSGTNQIGTLNDFSAAAGFTLNDGLPLLVAGSVTGGSNLAITDAGALTIGGSASAASIGLTAQSIAIPGTVNGGTVNLIASTGGITETGVLIAGTLAGSAAAGASLTGATPTANQIGTLVAFTAGSAVTLDDGTALTITGDVTGTSVALSAGSIDVLGSVEAGSVTLAGTTGPIVLTGNALVGQPGATVDLSAATGGLSESAGSRIIAAALQSSGGVTGSAILAGSGNLVGSIGAFNVSGGDFSLTDNGNVSIVGPLSGINVSVATTGAITGSGRVTAGPGGALALTGAGGITLGNGATLVSDTAIDLNGGLGPIVLNGGATVRSAGLLDLTTASGGVTEAPTSVIAASLLQSAAGVSGNVNLAGTANAIAQLGLFNTFGNFALRTAGALDVISNVSASSVSLNAAGGIAQTAGTLTGAVVDLSASSGGVSEATSAVINAGTLQSSLGISGNVSLPGISNTIGTLGPLAVSGGSFSLFNNTPLTVTGPLSADAVAINDGSSVVVEGLISAGNIAVTAPALLLPGTLMAAGTIDLVGGPVSETGGALIAGTLTGNLSGSANLGSGNNRVSTLSDFTTPIDFIFGDAIPLSVAGKLTAGSTASIVDAAGLTIAGTVSAIAPFLTADSIFIPGSVIGGTVTLTGTRGAISETGTIDAAMLTGSAAASATFVGVNQIGALGNFSASTGFTLSDTLPLNVIGSVTGGTSVGIVDSGTLTIGGAVSAAAVGLTANSISIPGAVSGGTGTFIATTGPINETGALALGTLNGSTPLTADFVGANTIGAFGPFSSNGLTLVNNTDLDLIGIVNAGTSAAITVGGSLSISGALAAGNISLFSGGAINETGALTASSITGAAVGDAKLLGNGGNQIATLNSFFSNTLFALNDSTDLTINGPLAAPTIVINVPNNLVTLSDGATIATGGIPRPPGSLTTFPTSDTTEGAYLTVGNFLQVGTSIVQGFGDIANPNILRISVAGAGGIVFSKVGGLQGSNTWLILDIDSGLASGNVFVRSLDVNRTGTTGATELVGTIAGVKGPAAAGAAGITPTPSSNFRFNSCPIHSVNCVLLTAQAIPTANPLNDIAIGSLYNPNDQDDLLLPIVSDQDY